MIVKARFVVPVDSPSIENGAMHVENGMIVALGRADSFPSRGVMDFGDAVVFPGFINAHTHLELSLLAGRVPPSPDFTGWLYRLIAARNRDLGAPSPFKGEGRGEGETRVNDERSSPNALSPLVPPARGDGVSPFPAQIEDSPWQGEGQGEGRDWKVSDYLSRAVKSGINQSLSGGVTAIADITAYPHWTRRVLAASAFRGISFGEVIAMGKGRTLLQSRLDAAAHTAEQTQRMKVGIAPHAPYSVEPDALRACAARAARNHLPLSVHVAETPEEELFTRNRVGSFAGFLAGLGLWDEDIPISRLSPVELLASADALTPSTVLAHANYVSDVDIALIAGSGASVAYCPRTHAAFGHAPHRFRDMLRAGINVCLGTDSLASNPSLSILDELRFLRARHGDLSHDLLVNMATLHGARAVQMETQIGSLSLGKSADFCVVPLPQNARRWSEVLETSDPAIATYVEGAICP